MDSILWCLAKCCRCRCEHRDLLLLAGRFRHRGHRDRQHVKVTRINSMSNVYTVLLLTVKDIASSALRAHLPGHPHHPHFHFQGTAVYIRQTNGIAKQTQVFYLMLLL